MSSPRTACREKIGTGVAAAHCDYDIAGLAQTQRRDANLEQRFGRAPKGIGEYVENVWQIILGALIGFVTSATTLSWVGWKLDLAAAAILAGVVLILRVRRLRPFAFAWLIGTQSVTVLIVGAVVLDWTRPQ
jgi:hypothetical protein